MAFGQWSMDHLQGKQPLILAFANKKRPNRGAFFLLERVKGIEPSYRAWEASVLPLNYTRMNAFILRVP